MNGLCAPIVASLVLAASASFVLALLAWRRRPAPGSKAASALMLGAAVWALGYALELASPGLPSKLLMAKVMRFGMAGVPTLWLIFTLAYTGRGEWLTGRNAALLSIEPLVMFLLAWTNEWHGLVYSETGLMTGGPCPALDVTLGPFSWVDVAYSYVLLLLGVITLVQAYVLSPPLHRRQIIALLIGAAVPVTAELLSIAGLRRLLGLSLTPFAFVVTNLAVTWALFRAKLLDLTPVARDAIIERMTDGVLVVDAEDRIADLNPAAEAIVGCPSAQAIGAPLARLLPGWPDAVSRHGEGAEAVEEIVLGRDGAQRTYELRQVALQGWRGRPAGKLLTLREITQRKRAEQALHHYSGRLEHLVAERTAEYQAQYARLEAILNAASDGIVVLDAQGNILQHNPVAHAWLTEKLSPQDAQRLRETIVELAGRAAERPETVLELPGLDLTLAAAPVSRTGGEAQGAARATAVVMMHDVSQMRALDRVRTNFITNISHELRTPSTTIKLYAHLMRARPDRWQDYLHQLSGAAEDLSRMVVEIVEVSAIDAGQLQLSPCLVPLAELTEAAVAGRRRAARDQGVKLEHRPADPDPVVLVDPARMEGVLDHLVWNAVRFTPRGGSAVVATGLRKENGRRWATATVSDTGIGIPPEELPYIHDRFFRGQEAQAMQLAGTGLGLAIAKEVVELSQGHLTVESRVGEGTTVTVWLPSA